MAIFNSYVSLPEGTVCFPILVLWLVIQDSILGRGSEMGYNHFDILSRKMSDAKMLWQGMGLVQKVWSSVGC